MADARPSEFASAAGWNKRMPVCRGKLRVLKQIHCAQAYKHQQHAHLHQDNEAVEIGRFFDSNHQHDGTKHDRQKAQQIENAMRVLKRSWINPQDLQLRSNSRKALPMSLVVNKLIPVRPCDRRRKLNAEVAEQTDEITTPA